MTCSGTRLVARAITPEKAAGTMVKRGSCTFGLAASVVLAAFGPVNTQICSAQSQSGNQSTIPPMFEVVSIRPDEPDGLSEVVRMRFERDGYSATHVTLKLLIEEAYGVDERQIVGAPPWINSEHYTIEARIDDATSEELARLDDDERNLTQQRMLQELLEDRFRLSLHRETNQLPIYSLAVAKHGLKLHQSDPGNTYANGTQWPGGDAMGPQSVSYAFQIGQVRMTGQGAPLALLVWRLTQHADALQLDRKIVDRTGLTGNYDFALHFTVPWPRGASQPNLFGEAEGGNQETDLATALQEQLGLRLESTKGLVETLLVTHVERPSAN